MARKRLSLLATTLRTRPLAFKEALVERFAREVLPKLATGRLEHIIDRVFVGLEQAQAAHEYMESNANVGKIVLKLA
ncbi:quinone oxidoreductase pig3 [Chrysochromulina tobinii]|uniref:Quinone oxidoreductase pig3 n=1 Tax=Chrysochromulina tobinii TaxID=1460289 RepID=A0A0M0JTZ9_9EUKA|nr:quinone oxidoreductase pig3 [Chrysochromulina tobinii]|eukprot:KOO29598.1 quinone oxidoreductase pig3 [Chrysochromulina sp. CCMP291]